ncbi:MAG: phosphoribosylglycinamide formyltransferase [Ekhidna sp.]|nr:phosphoribosylglycinamide formyltransferase [Ekhidna sp.]MBC6410553.1 phosphoribosylglycinamide formyltransferase [Ekhidna sp.]MBC6425858.1 phosphoribosylglycinamide formyltransferase [Ekhidna sp.]
MTKKIRITIFASGSGTNAENIIKYFDSNDKVNIDDILSNKEDAYIHERAKNLGVRSRSFSKEAFKKSSFVEKLQKTDYIILAGFLWLIPKYLIQAFPNRIINIHPALLPKYGGKGMYGKHVHKAVIDAGEEESGITVHLVNEEYDKGEVLFQAKCNVEKEDTPDTLAQKIHQLEYKHFPKVIERYVMENEKA